MIARPMQQCLGCSVQHEATERDDVADGGPMFRTESMFRPKSQNENESDATNPTVACATGCPFKAGKPLWYNRHSCSAWYVTVSVAMS